MSVDESGAPDTLRPVSDLSDLVDFLRRGETPRAAWRVGMEHEKIGLHEADLRRVPYAGDRGIGALLERIAELDGWKPLLEDGNVVALEKEGASITLEPGGQLELSGAPLRTIHEICSEFHRHLALIKRVSEPLGILWLRLGIDPLHDAAVIPRVPKKRYAVMREYLPSRGELAFEMMHATATVQANYDYADEADMAAKVRTALGVSPIVSAIFANSSVSGGKPNGFVSRRMHVWRHTDPDRTGLLRFVFEPDFGYAHYVEWALDVPMFFLLRDARYLPMRGKTFRRFLREGHEGYRATVEDFDLHLTTVFPEVRLKQFIEVRGADAVPAELVCSLPAIWKGLLYDDEALAAAWALVRDVSCEEWDDAHADVARRGLGAAVRGRSVLGLARELVEVASEGLRRIGHSEGAEEDERPFLDPIREQIELGRSPGEVVRRRWSEEWGESIERLIEYARY